MGKLERCAHCASILQAVATTIALGLGAWWFIEQRQTFPHGQIEQKVEVVPIDGRGLIGVEVQVRFQNTGKRLILLNSATVKLQEITADPYGYADLAAKNDETYWNATRPVETPDPRQFNRGELRWPIVKQFDGPIDHRIEPGETDLLVFTFLIPCVDSSSANARKRGRFRVATDIHKPAEKGEEDFAWKARDFVNVDDACSGKGTRK